MNERKGLIELADIASALSMQLLTHADQEDWEQLETIETERQEILKTIIGRLDAEKMGEEEALAIRRKIESIKVIDKKIIAATEKQRSQTTGEAAKLKNANKASKLYKQNR